MPDGAQVNFPDEMPPEQIKGLIASKFPDAVGQVAQPPNSNSSAPGNTGFSAITSPISDFINEQRQRGAHLNDIVNATQQGNKTLPEGIAEGVMNSVVAPVGDIAGAAGQMAGKMAYDMSPRPVQNVVDSAQQSIAPIAQAYQQNLDTYNKQNPRMGDALQAVRETVNLLPLGSSEVRGAIGEGIGASSNAIKNVGADVGANIGNNAVNGITRVAIGRNADQILAGRLKGIDLEDIKNKLMQSGDTAMLPDVTGDEVKGLMRAVGTMTGGAKQVVSDALEGRSEGAVKRVSEALSKNISNVDAYFTNLDDMANARAAIAGPMYQEAFSKNQNIMNPEIKRILNTPAGQSALRSAAGKMQNDMTLLGVPDKELAEQAKLAGTYKPGGIAQGFKLRTLDYVKRALDDQIGVAQRVGENDNARILTGLKNQLVSSLDKADITARAGPNSLKPEGGLYSRARKIYSDSFSLESAQQEGLQFLNRDPEEIRKFLINKSPSEKEAYRIGVRKSLQDIANKTPDGSDPAKRIFGNTQKREQLKAAFGDGENLKEFSKKMKEEIAAAQTKQKVLGGSRTDINLTDDAQFIHEALKFAKQGVSGKLVSAIGNSIYNRYVGLTKRNANRLAYILTNKQEGVAALDRLMKAEKDKSQRKLIIKAISDNKQD